MLSLIEDLLAYGIGISFERELNQFKMTLTRKGVSKHVVLPMDDHLNEFKIAKYAKLIQADLIKDEAEENLPHEISYVQCDMCSHKWPAVRPVGVKDLECPNCGTVGGFENLTT